MKGTRKRPTARRPQIRRKLRWSDEDFYREATKKAKKEGILTKKKGLLTKSTIRSVQRPQKKYLPIGSVVKYKGKDYIASSFFAGQYKLTRKGEKDVVVSAGSKVIADSAIPIPSRDKPKIVRWTKAERSKMAQIDRSIIAGGRMQSDINQVTANKGNEMIRQGYRDKKALLEKIKRRTAEK